MRDIIQSLEWRYAVKKFDSKRVLPQDKIDSLKKVFNLTATSYGLQPIKMLVLHNAELQQKLIAHTYGQKQVGQASHVLIICIENRIDSDYISRYFEKVRKVRGTSEEILMPFRDALVGDFSSKEVSEVTTWATNQAYLAMGNLLTFCAMEEIDSCPMEGFVAEDYDRLLGLDAMGLAPVLVMPVGFRATDDMFSQFKKVRKDLADSVIELF